MELMTVGPVYAIWWRMLMDLRPILRFFAERFPRLASPAVRWRTALHLAVGNPIQTLVVIYAVAAWRHGYEFQLIAIVCVAACLVFELCYQVVRVRGAHPSVMGLLGWREAWRFRRRFPSVWASGAAKTARVQAEVGTSEEPIASARLRPIADHPKMSWFPQVEWPIVSWWVGPPPGRTFDGFDEMAGVLAANSPHCVSVAVEYEAEINSYGRLIVSFVDAMGASSRPKWSGLAPVDTPPADFGPELDLLDRFGPSERPRLRLVPDDGEAS